MDFAGDADALLFAGGLDAGGELAQLMTRGLDLLFKQFLRSDIAEVDDDAPQATDMQAIGSGTLDVAPRAIAVPDAKLDRRAAIGRLQDGFNGRLSGRAVIGVNQLQSVCPDEGIGLVSEDPVDRGTDVANRGVGIHHADDFEAVLDEQTEPLFGFTAGLLGLFQTSAFEIDADMRTGWPGVDPYSKWIIARGRSFIFFLTIAGVGTQWLAPSCE